MIFINLIHFKWLASGIAWCLLASSLPPSWGYSRWVLGFTMGSWVLDKVHVKSLDFFEPCAKAAKLQVVKAFGVPTALGVPGFSKPFTKPWSLVVFVQAASVWQARSRLFVFSEKNGFVFLEAPNVWLACSRLFFLFWKMPPGKGRSNVGLWPPFQKQGSQTHVKRLNVGLWYPC